MDRNMVKAVVLVVESEALIRMSAIHMVEDAGFAAMQASNADEALKILAAHRDIRAVITDIDMSGSMDGLRLARLIKGRWPPVHLIVASGRNAPSKEELPANGRFIRKPYAFEHISAALLELFRSTPAPRRFLSGASHNYGKVA